MNSNLNLPIFLCYEDGGGVAALCPLLLHLHCNASSRSRALVTMQKLIQDTLAMRSVAETQMGQRYEVVHLAVAPSSDSGNQFSIGGSLRPKAERPRIEVL